MEITNQNKISNIIIDVYIDKKKYITDNVFFIDEDTPLSLKVVNNNKEDVICNILLDDEPKPSLSVIMLPNIIYNIDSIFSNNDNYKLNIKYKISLLFNSKNDDTLPYYEEFYFYKKELNEYILLLQNPINCDKCNTTIKLNWNYCPICGLKLNNNSTPQINLKVRTHAKKEKK